MTDKPPPITGRVVTLVGAVLAPLKVERNERFNEIELVRYAFVPLFFRDVDGRPRVLGIPFPRWKKPRK